MTICASGQWISRTQVTSTKYWRKHTYSNSTRKSSSALPELDQVRCQKGRSRRGMDTFEKSRNHSMLPLLHWRGMICPWSNEFELWRNYSESNSFKSTQAQSFPHRTITIRFVQKLGFLRLIFQVGVHEPSWLHLTHYWSALIISCTNNGDSMKEGWNGMIAAMLLVLIVDRLRFIRFISTLLFLHADGCHQKSV